jgi:hypothetical protein
VILHLSEQTLKEQTSTRRIRHRQQKKPINRVLEELVEHQHQKTVSGAQLSFIDHLFGGLTLPHGMSAIGQNQMTEVRRQRTDRPTAVGQILSYVKCN